MREAPSAVLLAVVLTLAAVGVSCTAEDEYDEESFPYAHLFKAGGGPDSTPFSRYRHAVKDARDTGWVPVIVCFEEPFPLTVNISAEEEQRYKQAVSDEADKIVASIRRGKLAYVKKRSGSGNLNRGISGIAA